MQLHLMMAMQVGNCSGGLLPIQAQQVSVAAQDQQSLTYEVYATNATAQETNACNVTLLNSGVRF